MSLITVCNGWVISTRSINLPTSALRNRAQYYSETRSVSGHAHTDRYKCNKNFFSLDAKFGFICLYCWGGGWGMFVSLIFSAPLISLHGVVFSWIFFFNKRRGGGLVRVELDHLLQNLEWKPLSHFGTWQTEAWPSLCWTETCLYASYREAHSFAFNNLELYCIH